MYTKRLYVYNNYYCSDEIKESFTSGPYLLLIVRGNNLYENLEKMIGEYNYWKCRRDNPESIRAQV